VIRFFVVLLLTAGVIVAAVHIGVAEGYFSQPTFFWKSLIFLTFSTAMIFVYLYKANNPGFFLQLYLLTMVVKLLAYCAFCLVMILTDKRSAIGNAVFFMSTYFVFTVIEIAFLFKRINGQKGS
jgi:hypothetical protein